MNASFRFNFQEPIVFTAIHNGHEVRDEIIENFKIEEDVQLREEDPFTEFFAEAVDNRIIVNTSRFEVDLNRSRNKCVYLKPEDAWGIEVHKNKPTADMIVNSQKKYDIFYNRTKLFFDEMARVHKYFFVLDIHSYNHHRMGINEPFDNPKKNPEIILGTNNMDKKYFSFVEAVQKRIRDFDYLGRQLDTRVNVKYPGGNFSRWIHNSYPNKAICIALEFEKIFMNEWTAEIYQDKMNKLKEMLKFLLPELQKLMINL